MKKILLLFQIGIICIIQLHLIPFLLVRAEEGIHLTSEEEAFLSHLNYQVQVCVDPDWEPYEKLTKGSFTGIGADLMYLVGERLQIDFVITPTTDWAESIQVIQNLVPSKSCQMIPFLNQTPSRETYLSFTDPVFVDPQVFITRQEYLTPAGQTNITSPSTLGNQILVLPAGTSVEERIREEFPNIQILIVESEADVFQAIEEKRADFGLRSRMVAFHVIRQEGYFNLRIAGNLETYDNYLRMGVRKDHEILRDILNKAIATITEEERIQIINRHVFFVVEEAIDYQRLLVVGIVIISFLALFFWMERGIRKANKERMILLDRMPALVWIAKRNLKVGFINQAAQAFFLGTIDRSQNQIEIKDVLTDQLLKQMEWALNHKHPLTDEMELVSKGGIKRTFHVEIYPQVSRRSRVKMLTCIAQDITHLRDIITKEQELNHYLRDIIDYLPDPTFITDEIGRLTYWNRAVERFTGLKKEEAIGLFPKDYSKILYGYETDLLIVSLLSGNKVLDRRYQNVKVYPDMLLTEVQILDYRKMKRLVEVVSALIRNEQNRIVGSITTFRDITDVKAKEQEILYLSQHDSLTQLLNRTYFDQVRSRFENPQVFPLGVIMADLNDLKRINDTFGHQAGDELLQAFAHAFQTEERPIDIVARLGGDEFILLLPNLGLKECLERYQLIQSKVDQIRVHNQSISVAMGLAHSLSVLSFDELIKQSEEQMYQNKENYRKNNPR